MQLLSHRSLSLTAAAALALAAIPQVNAQPAEVAEGSADDLGVMSISLDDVVKPTIGFQGALQGAGTPNQAGVGGFLPLSVGENSVWFLDALVNASFADREGYSSIIDTTVAGTTISTSSRLGYRWLNGDRSWMYGINAGYDSRPMNTGYADSGIEVEDGYAFYQQIGLNLEAISNKWSLNAYGLFPLGETTKELNWNYSGGALQTYGLDAGYMVTPTLKASLGGYYQKGDYNKCRARDEVDNAGLRGRLSYKIANGLVAGINASYDDSYDWRASVDITYRFGGSNSTAANTNPNPTIINALTSSPKNRDVRVHDTYVNTGYDAPDPGALATGPEAEAQIGPLLPATCISPEDMKYT